MYRYIDIFSIFVTANFSWLMGSLIRIRIRFDLKHLLGLGLSSLRLLPLLSFDFESISVEIKHFCSVEGRYRESLGYIGEISRIRGKKLLHPYYRFVSRYFHPCTQVAL